MRFSLTSGHPVILDGAMGTELIARGLDIRSDIAERWVLECGDEVKAIHREYAASGAEVIQTCTFGALRSRLIGHGLGDRVAEICTRAVELARTAAPQRSIVASLGPTGLITASGGGQDATVRARIEAELTEAATALAEAEVDAIHLETQYNPAELVAAAAGIRTGAPATPLWISITLMTGASGLETPQGVPIEHMLRALRTAGPDAVGVNCSLDADRIRGAVERLVAADLGPVLVRPQARISEKCATGRSRETPLQYAERASQLFSLGATAVGGCCGTNPASIAALTTRVGGRIDPRIIVAPLEVAR